MRRVGGWRSFGKVQESVLLDVVVLYSTVSQSVHQYTQYMRTPVRETDTGSMTAPLPPCSLQAANGHRVRCRTLESRHLLPGPRAKYSKLGGTGQVRPYRKTRVVFHQAPKAGLAGRCGEVVSIRSPRSMTRGSASKVPGRALACKVRAARRTLLQNKTWGRQIGLAAAGQVFPTHGAPRVSTGRPLQPIPSHAL